MRGIVCILISDRTDFKTKVLVETKWHFKIKGSIHQEDITIMNIYASNNWAPKYMKQKVIKKRIIGRNRQFENNSGGFNITFWIITGRATR